MKFQEHIDIPCIWHLNSQELLSNCGFSYVYCSEKGMYIPDFIEKIIIDFWCGVSDLLDTIDKVSDPEKLYGIDPIFKNNATLVKAKNNLEQHLRKYSSLATSLIREPLHQERMIWTSGKIRERFRVLYNFDTQNHNISYNSDISCTPKGKIDIIFISFLMYRISQHTILIEMLLSYLRYWGQLYITDFPLLDRFPVIENYSPTIVSYNGGQYTTLQITK